MTHTIRYCLGWYKFDSETGTHCHDMAALSHKTEEDARRAYDSLAPTDNYPQIELWREIYDKTGALEDREKIAMKDASGEWPWWEF